MIIHDLVLYAVGKMYFSKIQFQYTYIVKDIKMQLNLNFINRKLELKHEAR